MGKEGQLVKGILDPGLEKFRVEVGYASQEGPATCRP